MTKQPLVVQFIHPGTEHVPVAVAGEPDRTEWNAPPKKHRRKFMLQHGRWVAPEGRAIGSRWKAGEADLMFWGEWEPESELVKRLDASPMTKEPRYLVRPFWKARRSYASLHNTDPFVFEQPFKYIVCLQTGRMTDLPAGSLILFGSEDRSASAFTLDTVFVVAEQRYPYVLERAGRDLERHVSETYYAASVAPMLQPADCLEPGRVGETKRVLYTGATFEEPVNGMFSFFPCQVYEGQEKGFVRPTLDLDLVGMGADGRPAPVVKGDWFNGKRYTCHGSTEAVRGVWEAVVEKVLERGLAIGVQATLPSKR